MRKNIIFVIVISTIISLFLASPSLAAEKTPITVGWPQYGEQAILGHMITILISENTDIPVKTVEDVGGTGIFHQMMNSGAIDIGPDYTGDALCNVLNQKPIANPREAWQACKEGYLEKYDITWLEPTKFNNTYALAVPAEVAEKYELETISDIRPYAENWLLSSSVEFSQRQEDGYPAMIEYYDLEFKDIRPMNPGLMYTAVASGKVDIIVAFATDARIAKFNLQLLEDDKEFFPAYNAAVTVHNDILEKYPELEPMLNEVFSNLDAETIIGLNARESIEGERRDVIAREYLESEGYI